ncbi:Arm DNA-binding domain-containing protein [Burkholderia sp. IDO3]|uniref:Arm DNA-binding domain-containing protein n=1 Tax=Burkholderia sp. IDO3 TaxID=1705310 RepID=UPI0026C7DA57
MALSDLQCKNAKYNPSGTGNKLADGDSLFLFLMPTGSKLWRYLYRDAFKKQKTLSIGAYPAVGLQTARKKRDEARAQIAEGVDPSEAKKAAKQAAVLAASNSLEAVARVWMEERAVPESSRNNTAKHWLVSSAMCSRGWGNAPLIKSMRLKFYL